MTDSPDRQLGLLDCILLSLGGMIGSAIFIFPGTTGQLAGPAAIGAWLLAGLLMGAIALLYTELSLAFPTTGSIAVYPYETLGPYPSIRAFASYLEGVSYVVGWLFGLTISALAVGQYLSFAVPGAGGHTVALAVGAIALAAGVNLLGVRITSRANLVIAAFLLAALLVFVATGLASVDPGNYQPLFTGDALGFFAAVQVSLTAYGAWTAIPAVVGEIENPAKTVPRAVLLSLGAATVLYTAIVAVLHGLIPGASFVEGADVLTAPLGAAAAATGVGWLRFLLSIGAVGAIFTTLLVGVMSAGRVLFALGENDTLPSAFATTSERTDVPWVGVVAVAAVAAGLATVPGQFYQLLVVAAVVGTGVPYAINILSFVGFRYYRPNVETEFRAPGGYALPVVAFCVLGIAMFGLGTTELLYSAGALAGLSLLFVVRVALGPAIIERARSVDVTGDR